MARIVKEKEYSLRRKEIIDVAQRLMYTKGYEQMSIQDILDELEMSKGAFYHYFDSKPDLLEAMIEQIAMDAQQQIMPILEDPHRPALEKLHQYFAASARWKAEHKSYILALLNVWYTDDNAIVRQKVQVKLFHEFVARMGDIVRQGIQEGVFDTPYPDMMGEITLHLILALGEAFTHLILHPVEDGLARAERMVAAYNLALERVLGAAKGSITLMDAKTVREWVS